MKLILALIVIILWVELVLQLKKTISSLFSDTVTRADYISEKYHKYLKRVDSWDKPMFKYIPIGLRVFNNDNPIPGIVKNNSLGFRAPDFDKAHDDEIRVVLLGGLLLGGLEQVQINTLLQAC